jgi:hypothetical protein
MPPFRKRPVVIEAVQWFKMGDHPAVIHGWQSMKAPEQVGPAPHHEPLPGFRHVGLIETMEGYHVVSPGDWIIRGIQGELYPCKPDIFEATYEPAEAMTISLPVASFSDVLLVINTKVQPIITAARAFVDRLQEVESDARWKQVWTMAHIHGLPYTGPFFADEAKALRKALDEAGV